MTFSSKWQWNGIDLWVNESAEQREIKRAELFVLDDDKSTFNFFGAGSPHFNIKGKVITYQNRNSILADAIANTTRSLTTPYGTTPNLKIHGTPKFTSVQYSGATFGGVNYTSDVTEIFDFEMELIDVS